MGKKLDIIIIVDVEATCWSESPPPGQENEIIEIGICTLDIATGKRLEKESILVKPERSTVSEFCTQLTTLTQAQVDTGISFAEACAMLKQKYLSHQRVWASYGDYDRRQFERQCQSRQISYPFGTRHINVKTLFAIVHGLSIEVGMDEALQLLNLPLEGTHHRGGDDAWNIAAIFSELLLKRPIQK
ncbi:exonuclease domain-containing protein [Planktothrix sp. FACHB-1355]|uniref:Exonuclease domain-containing protein n=1 Tax=Aerosakkonema funiforme FACHB-1375 TaxID=2949571 RepID=A0A926ZIM1_9CYAN|nr:MULTISPECIES: 3'-5' exonuclease [Oscillatoriales]MBD2184598.1 exonuclease domain-containing protein [Aerosakkonema funiforme FACHB-1375]MBD3558202.1 exonuclease domain-containing protein [Planktothrix sp. FACHB-1355]